MNESSTTRSLRVLKNQSTLSGQAQPSQSCAQRMYVRFLPCSARDVHEQMHGVPSVTVSVSKEKGTIGSGNARRTITGRGGSRGTPYQPGPDRCIPRANKAQLNTNHVLPCSSKAGRTERTALKGRGKGPAWWSRVPVD